MEHDDLAGDHNGAEAVLRLSPDEDAVAGGQLILSAGRDVNALVPILDKERGFTCTPVSHSGLEGHGKLPGGFGMGEGVSGMQGGQRGGRAGPDGRGASEKKRDSGNGSLHRD